MLCLTKGISIKFISLFNDRFSQFFISPLMREDSIEREVQAVDSGTAIFYINLFSDPYFIS